MSLKDYQVDEAPEGVTIQVSMGGGGHAGGMFPKRSVPRGRTLPPTRGGQAETGLRAAKEKHRGSS